MRFFLLLALLALVAVPAQAQLTVLPYAGYDFDAENPLIGVGVEFALPITAPVAVSLRPSGEYMFTRDLDIAGRLFSQTIGQVNLDVIARLRSPGLQPYGGAGVAFRFVSLDTSDDDDVEGDQDSASTNVGANLIGGVALGALGPVRPFVQGRVTLAEETAFALAGGIMLRF